MTNLSHGTSKVPESVSMAPPEEVDYEALPTTSVKVQLLAGALAGIAEHTLLYPFDAIKTRMQVVKPTPAAVYNSVLHAVSRIASTEGAVAMWRGITSVALGAGPAHAVYFTTYEIVKEQLGGNQVHGHHFLATFLAGGCAAITSDAIMTPFDVIKQRMQVHGSPYRSVFGCAATVFRNEGLGAFFVSYPTTLAGSIPLNAIQFAAYDSLSRVLNPTRKYDPFVHCISGGLAGSIAAALTTPFDVAKTLLQTRGTSTDPTIRECKSLTGAFKIIFNQYGVRGFMKGLGPRVISIFPSTAICWSVYEFFKHFLYKNGSSGNGSE